MKIASGLTDQNIYSEEGVTNGFIVKRCDNRNTIMASTFLGSFQTQRTMECPIKDSAKMLALGLHPTWLKWRTPRCKICIEPCNSVLRIAKIHTSRK